MPRFSWSQFTPKQKDDAWHLAEVVLRHSEILFDRARARHPQDKKLAVGDFYLQAVGEVMRDPRTVFNSLKKMDNREIRQLIHVAASQVLEDRESIWKQLKEEDAFKHDLRQRQILSIEEKEIEPIIKVEPEALVEEKEVKAIVKKIVQPRPHLRKTRNSTEGLPLFDHKSYK